MIRFASHKSAKAALALLTGSVIATGFAGCRINGGSKEVQVDSPFGVHVNTDQTKVANLGLPAYPGARITRGDDSHESADVDLGFGEWRLSVRKISYETSDSEEDVAKFYKKALARYGKVLTCKDNEPIGSPTVTSDGLTCSLSGHGSLQISSRSYTIVRGDQSLKAGSVRHQHVVRFESPKNGKTRFALIAVDLPAGSENLSGQSD